MPAHVALTTRARGSAHTSRCTEISVRKSDRVVQSRIGNPMATAYQRAGALGRTGHGCGYQAGKACSPSLTGRLVDHICGDSEYADEHGERQQPDEHAVGEGSGHDPAADVRVAIDRRQRDVDRAVSLALGVGALDEPSLAYAVIRWLHVLLARASGFFHRRASMPSGQYDSGETARSRRRYVGDSGKTRSVILAVLAALALALASAPTASADLADETALAERYAPVVRLVEQAQECGYGRSYSPLDVDLLFDEPTVALRGPWGGTS